MNTLPHRPLGFGEIVGGAFQLYRRDFALYYVIALLAYLPGYLLSLATVPYLLSGAFEIFDAIEFASDPDVAGAMMDWPGSTLGFAAPAAAVGLAAALFAFAGSVALTAAMARRLDDRPVSLRGSYRLALRHLLRAVGATVLSFVILVAVIGTGMLVGVVVMMFTAVGDAFLGDLGLFGMGAFAVVPVLAAAVIGVAWNGATFGILPAVVVEDRGAASAVGRSMRLWSGSWLRIFGVQAVVWIVGMIIAWIPGVVFGVGWMASSFTLEAMGAGGLLVQSAGLVAGSLTAPLAIAGAMVLFHDCRVRREAFDPDPHAEPLDPS